MRRAIVVLALALAAPAQYAEGKADPAFLAQARELATRQRDTFGDLTVAVDWFHDVTKLTRAEAFDAVGLRQRIARAAERAVDPRRE